MQFRLNHIIYFCADMAAMTAFYTQVLGMEPIANAQFPPDEWLELDGGGFKLCLHKAGKPGSPERSRNKIVFLVDDVGAARDYLLSKKVKMGVHHKWPGMDACDGRDPRGQRVPDRRPANVGANLEFAPAPHMRLRGQFAAGFSLSHATR